MYKFVFLDLDNTILDFDAAEAAALPAALLENGVTPSEELNARYHVINNEEWEKYERGEITRDRVLISRYERLFAEFGITADPVKTEDCYRRRLSVGHYFVPGAPELLEYLKSRKYLLYLASNGVAATQKTRLESAGIVPYFEDIFISETTGFHKPEPEYFDYCFRRIPGFAKSCAIMIGDSLSSDIRGGINAGIDTCWFNRCGVENRSGLTPAFTIRSLGELKKIL